MSKTWQWLREAPSKMKVVAPIVIAALGFGGALVGYGVGMGEGRATDTHLSARVAAVEVAIPVAIASVAQAKVDAAKEVVAAKDALRAELSGAIESLRTDVAKTTTAVAELRGTLNAIARYFNIDVPARSP